jgi:hypothetical protein
LARVTHHGGTEGTEKKRPLLINGTEVGRQEAMDAVWKRWVVSRPMAPVSSFQFPVSSRLGGDGGPSGARVGLEMRKNAEGI